MTGQQKPTNAKEILVQATPEQIRWVIERLFTKTDKAAAKKAKVHYSTVSKWPNKADLDRAVNILLSDMAEQAGFILSQAAPEAARALVEALGDKKSRVPAANSILDRSGVPGVQEMRIKEPLLIREVVIEKMKDESLEDRE